MRWHNLRRDPAARSEAIAELLRTQSVVDGHLEGDCKTATGMALVGADLRKADLRFALLERTDLRRADLREANLDRADLSGADLSGANLCGASFRGARLLDTLFHGADVDDVDFSHVSGLTAAAFRGATSVERALWPVGFSTTESKNLGPMLHTRTNSGSVATRR